MAEPEPQAVLQAGYLQKKRPHLGLGMWQKRWFVLAGDTLTYYKTEEDAGSEAAAAGGADSENTILSVKGDRSERFVICSDDLSGKKREFTLNAATAAEAASWVATLSSVLAATGDLKICRATLAPTTVRHRRAAVHAEQVDNSATLEGLVKVPKDDETRLFLRSTFQDCPMLRELQPMQVRFLASQTIA